MQVLKQHLLTVTEYFSIVDLQNKKFLKYTDPGQNGYKKIQASQAIHIKSLSVLMQLNDIL